jgi:antitoxin ParD1/3/4
MPSMNVSLTEELMCLVQKKVSSGMYNNASEVVREAIRSLDKNEKLIHELQLVRLKETLASGIKQAEQKEYADYSYDTLMSEIDRETRNP